MIPTAEEAALRGRIAQLEALNAELLAALEFAAAVIGHPDDTGSRMIAATIAKAKEGK